MVGTSVSPIRDIVQLTPAILPKELPKYTSRVVHAVSEELVSWAFPKVSDYLKMGIGLEHLRTFVEIKEEQVGLFRNDFRRLLSPQVISSIEGAIPYDFDNVSSAFLYLAQLSMQRNYQRESGGSYLEEEQIPATAEFLLGKRILSGLEGMVCIRYDPAPLDCTRLSRMKMSHSFLFDILYSLEELANSNPESSGAYRKSQEHICKIASDKDAWQVTDKVGGPTVHFIDVARNMAIRDNASPDLVLSFVRTARDLLEKDYAGIFPELFRSYWAPVHGKKFPSEKRPDSGEPWPEHYQRFKTKVALLLADETRGLASSVGQGIFKKDYLPHLTEIIGHTMDGSIYKRSLRACGRNSQSFKLVAFASYFAAYYQEGPEILNRILEAAERYAIKGGNLFARFAGSQSKKFYAELGSILEPWHNKMEQIPNYEGKAIDACNQHALMKLKDFCEKYAARSLVKTTA